MKISQREARRLQRRVCELEEAESNRRNRWKREYPGGVHIGSINMTNLPNLQGRVEASRLLGHAVVVTAINPSEINLYALPLGDAHG